MSLDHSEGRGTAQHSDQRAFNSRHGMVIPYPGVLPVDEWLLGDMLYPGLPSGPETSAGASGSIILHRYIAYNI